MNSSLEFEILDLLREAGEENLATVFNTLLITHPAEPRGALFNHIAVAIRALEAQGNTEFMWYRNGWQPLSGQEREKLQTLDECLVWDAHLDRWRWDEQVNAEQPILVLTDKGRAHLRAQVHRA